MSAFDETSRHLRELLKSGYLHEDARSDVAYMLGLHTTRQYHLDRFSPIVLVYPFLVNPHSGAGRVLRSLLAGYSGDLFQEIALDDAYDYQESKSSLVKSEVPYPLENRCFQQAATYLAEPLHSGDLLTALLICPLFNWKSELNREMEILELADDENANVDDLDLEFRSDAQIYARLRRGYRLPKHSISNTHSEIASFLITRGINPGTVAMRLKGYGAPAEPDNVKARYSLGVGILPSGFLKVQIFDRWGTHELAENDRLISAPHGLLLPETVVFLQSEIEHFENLLNARRSVPEEAYQEFFEAHPKWLYLLGEQYDEYNSQVRLPPMQLTHQLVLSDEPIDKMWLKPDFLLKRVGLDLWDVLDIKASDCRIVVGRKSRNKFSEAVAEAVAQLREYSRRLQQHEVRSHLKVRHNLTVSEPVPMVLIGRDFDFKTLQKRAKFRESEGVRVYTYDDLHRLAKHRTLVL